MIPFINKSAASIEGYLKYSPKLIRIIFTQWTDYAGSLKNCSGKTGHFEKLQTVLFTNWKKGTMK
ncbi:hypothetical protein EP47_10890 [Legionella norrlandica]|uniref:Uncharacterized protein n=1 Tax=Legionella norrlandica TaxID=1498499 RepID=A0A0A2SVC6_9GAMM|nr:hypothetical protein EP47_10890 [Legionella norrlandica]